MAAVVAMAVGFVVVVVEGSTACDGGYGEVGVAAVVVMMGR